MNMYISFGIIVMTAVYFETIPGSNLAKMTAFLVVGFIYVATQSINSKKGIKAIEKLLVSLKDGNLSSKGGNKRLSKELLFMQKNIEGLRNNLRGNNFETQVISSQITAVSQNIALSLESSIFVNNELSDKADELTSLNEESNDRINKTVIEVAGIVNLLEQVQKASKWVKNNGEESKVIIDDSIKDISKIVNAVEEIDKSSKITLSRVNALGETSKEIATILQTVDNIAEETNLLALNAAIESARAGEAGRGFAVVADEIRKLSENSKSSVSLIADLVEKITFQVQEVLAAIKPNVESVEKSVEHTKNIETSLSKIKGCYDELTSSIEGILDKSGEEFLLANNISQKIVEVQSTYDKVNDSVRAVRSSIDDQTRSIKDIGALGSSLTGAADSLSIIVKKSKDDLLNDNYDKFLGEAKKQLTLIKEKLLKIPEIQGIDPAAHKLLLDEYIKEENLIEAIWTNSKKGKFIYSNPPAGIVNGKVREWFQESIKGVEYTSKVYISAITKNPCITASLPIIDKDGMAVGVLGVDIKISLS